MDCSARRLLPYSTFSAYRRKYIYISKYILGLPLEFDLSSHWLRAIRWHIAPICFYSSFQWLDLLSRSHPSCVSIRLHYKRKFLTAKVDLPMTQPSSPLLTSLNLAPSTSPEGKRNLRLKESQFISKHGHRHHSYDNEKAPYPLSYDRHVLEMWVASAFVPPTILTIR